MTISNSGSDERGKSWGGKAGDQTGGEWRIRSWYQSGWDVILRHPDAKVREMIADMAEAAAKNDKIGYDQGQRLTFYNNLKTVGWKPEKITTACEADCSAGVTACVIGTGYRLGVSKLKSVKYDSYTGNLRSRLKAAGFELLTASKYLSGDSYLVRGDILLNDVNGGHTCINLTNGSKSVAASSSYDKTPDTVKEVQIYMNKVYGYSLATDNVFGPKTKAAIVKEVQKLIGTTADGIFGTKSKAAWKTVRKGASGKLAMLCQMMLIARGYSVGSCGADGEFGTATKSAVVKFQKANKILAGGGIGKNTAAKLFG